MTRRGSYFFVIDAFIASIIILGMIVVLFTDYSAKAPATQALYTAEDFLGVIEITNVRDYDDDQVRAWMLDGTINDTSRTLLQQLAYFNVTSNLSQARTLANLTIADVPEQVNVRLLIAGEAYGWRELVPAGEATAFFSSKRIVTLRNYTTALYPPVVIEVQTWQ